MSGDLDASWDNRRELLALTARMAVVEERAEEARQRATVLECQVLALREEMGAMIERANRAMEAMDTALQAANQLIAHQEDEISAMQTADVLLRM